jgi:hypothetical protein
MRMTTAPPERFAHLHCTRTRLPGGSAKIKSKRPPSAIGR